MDKFETWFINIVTAIVFIGLLILGGTIVGFIVYEFWQFINQN